MGKAMMWIVSIRHSWKRNEILLHTNKI